MRSSVIGLMLLLKLACTLDYNSNHTLICSQISKGTTEANLSQLWNILILHSIDRYLFLVSCPIIAILQLSFIATYIRWPKLRIRPGNIFCGLVIIEALLNLILLANAIYSTANSQNEPMPSSFVAFCSATGLIEGFLTIIHFFYLGMFLVYTIFLFRFSLKKKSDNFWMGLHIFVVILCIGITLALFFDEFMGLNFYGICGMTPTRRDSFNVAFPVVEIVLAIIFCLIGLFTYSYFNKHMPGGEVFRRKKLKESRIIILYVAGFSAFLFFTGLLDLLLNINCLKKSPQNSATVIATIVNIMRIFQFVYLLFLILMQDNFRRKYKNQLKRLFQASSDMRGSSFVEQNEIQREIEMQKLAFDEKLLKIKEKENKIDLLLVSQIYTIISGVYVANFEYNSEEDSVVEIRRIHFKENISFQINNSSLLNYETEERSILRIKALSCHMTLHTPRVFRKLLEMDGITNVYESFNIMNVKKIWNLAEGDGGRSGEFFFFSTDNKFVLKTITVEEFEFLLENIESFYEFYKNNPKSLLAKIYGLYTIKGNEIQRTYRLILMKNILGCPRSQVLRIYDMKGSKYDRQVIKDEEQENQIEKITLKDIDFMNYEGKIHIDEILTDELREILSKDSHFLKEMNLIDYSLLVVRVMWNTPPKNQHFWSSFQRINNVHNQNQYYHLGVIDYMQKWDLQKKGEKWWKNLMGKKDVSAAEPNFYQKRFMQFVDEIVKVLPKNEKEKEEFEMNSVRSEKVGKKTKDSEEMRRGSCDEQGDGED